MTVLLYFTAEWCGPCKKFGPALMREADARDIEVKRIDIDGSPDTAAAYEVMSVPTVVAVHNRIIVDRFGNLPAPQLRARLDALNPEVTA